MIERTIAASTHGRYLVAPPSAAEVSPLLVGFHGYAENAELQLERLTAIPGTEQWLVVSVQGLHSFYRGRSEQVVASWMTRENRELAIADNAGYVSSIVDAVSREWNAGAALVFAGFSQGVAMAFRAAVASPRPVSGIVAVGGDVPPELDRSALARIPAAHLGRGADDPWYTSEKCATDVQRLQTAGVDVRTVEFAGAHEWSVDFNEAAGAFLRRCR